MYKTLAYDRKYALNAICPYFTMFPLEFPLKALKKHKGNSSIVFDPFCGRGTTIYAARNLGMQAWGFDTSLIAVAITKAKLAAADKRTIISLAKEFLAIEPKNIPNTQFFRAAYSQKTIKELCSIREGLIQLQKETSASILLRAAMLGCLHGPLSKTVESAGYFSNQMPRTFSTKPNYSIQYWKKRDLKAPKIAIIDVLDRKLSRISDLDTKLEGSPDQIICTNSCESSSYKALPKDISIVVTSPPYFGMSTYEQDQWMRKWFLGGPETVDYHTANQIKHGCVDTFIKDLAKVWKNIQKSKSENLDLYVRFGSLPCTKTDANQVLRSSFDLAGGWKILSVRSASNSRQGKRQADQMTPNSRPIDEFDFHIIRA